MNPPTPARAIAQQISRPMAICTAAHDFYKPYSLQRLFSFLRHLVSDIVVLTLWPVIVMFFAALGTNATAAEAANANGGAVLAARYLALKPQLDNSPFKRPLHMSSGESSASVNGEIHAVFNHPFATLGSALNQAAQWCEILILHPNTKYCRASNERADGTTSGPTTSILNVAIGRKAQQALNDAYSVNFGYRVISNSRDFLQIRLSAENGPLSTRNYRIVLEAIPLENGKSFVRMAYSYDFGFGGRVAMQAYLGTVGRNKSGFTVIGKSPNGQPQYVGGMRGLVERNTMRYYLAIESFMGALSTPAPARIEKSLRDWFAASERYPLQLHEIDQVEYLDMKRTEYRRQQSAVLAATRIAAAD